MAGIADLGCTPVKASAAGQNRYAQELATAGTLQNQLASDMSGHFIGPIGPQEFLDTFMAPAPTQAPKLTIRAPNANHTERHMYGSFVSSSRTHALAQVWEI